MYVQPTIMHVYRKSITTDYKQLSMYSIYPVLLTDGATNIYAKEKKDYPQRQGSQTGSVDLYDVEPW